MESFFATLKKEKLYQLHTEKLPMAQVKSVVFRCKKEIRVDVVQLKMVVSKEPDT